MSDYPDVLFLTECLSDTPVPDEQSEPEPMAKGWKDAKRGDSPDPWAIQHESTNLCAALYMQTYRQVVAASHI